MTFRKNIVALSLLTAFAVTSLVPSAAGAAESHDALKLIPADAWGFVAIRSLEAVDQRAAQLNDILGLGIPSPVTPMALGMLNVGDVIDMKRPLCLVMMDAQKFGGAGGPGSAAVLLVPTSDPKAMIQKLTPPPPPEGGEGEDAPDAGEPAAEGIQKISLMGQPSYAAIKGKYVIVGQSQDCVTNVLKTKKTMDAGFAPARSKALAKSDIYISASLRAVVTAYKDMISMMLPMMTAAVDPEGKSAQDLISLLMQMGAIDISLGLEKDGLAVSYLVVPTDGSDLQKTIKSTENVSGSLLTMLPKEQYLAALGATSTYNADVAPMGQDKMLSTILKSAQVEGVNDAAIKVIDAECLTLLKSFKSLAFCVSALPQGAEGLIGITVAVETNDAKAFLASARKLYGAMWNLCDDEDVANVKEHVKHVEDAETVAGRKVDTVTMKLSDLAEMFEMEADDLKKAQAVLGKECVFRFGAVDDKHFLFAFGGGKARLAKASEAVTSRSGPSLADDEGIGALSKRLPSPRSAEGYVAIDNIVHFAKTIAKTLGQEEEIPFDLPMLNAPVAFGGAGIDGIQQADFFVPMKLITAVKKSFEEMTKAEMKNFDEDEDEDAGDDGADED